MFKCIRPQMNHIAPFEVILGTEISTNWFGGGETTPICYKRRGRGLLASYLEIIALGMMLGCIGISYEHVK